MRTTVTAVDRVRFVVARACYRLLFVGLGTTLGMTLMAYLFGIPNSRRTVVFEAVPAAVALLLGLVARTVEPLQPPLRVSLVTTTAYREALNARSPEARMLVDTALIERGFALPPLPQPGSSLACPPPLTHLGRWRSDRG